MTSSGSLIWNNADPPAPGCLPGLPPLRRRAARDGDTAGPSAEGGCEELPRVAAQLPLQLGDPRPRAATRR